jgi:RsiW-degrading membrane proteinase PrsW (M82 family)
MLVYLGILMFAALLARQVYQYDRYHKASRPLLLLAFGLGFACMLGVGHLEDLTQTLLKLVEGNRLAAQAMVAAGYEELARLAIVGLIAVAFRRQFHDPMDGLVFGALTGLGMALEESLFFVGLASEPGLELIGTEAVRLLLHVMLGGLTALGVGLVANRGRQGMGVLTAGLSVSIALHWSWDALVGLPQLADEVASLALRSQAIGLMLATMALFGGAVVLASRWSREVFAPHSRERLCRWPLVRSPGPAASDVLSLSVSRI